MTERTAEEIKAAVVERYGSHAREQLGKTGQIELTATGESACCDPSPSGEGPAEETSGWAEKLYSAQDLGALPQEVTELSLGCGNPTAIAELRPGEAVLDLGSGSGLDCFLAAQQVGPQGRVVGLDMTDDMLALAQRNLAKVGAANVEFHKGEMESMPLPSDTFDVIKLGGRMRVSDIVWTRPPTEAETENLASRAGCIAGALEIDEYVSKLCAAGFANIDVQLANQAEDRGWASAYITARKAEATGCC
jgi:arsenite methyltransferase